MPEFQFQAITTDGRQETGNLEAENSERAHDLLMARGLTPISLSNTTIHDNAPWWSRDIAIFGPQVNPRDTAAFFQTFSTMLEAKLPMKTVLEYSAKQATSKPFQRALDRVSKDLQNGETLTVAMGKHPKIFDARYVTVLQIGERSNSITLAAAQCAEMIQAEQEMKSEIRAAMVYPIILLLMALIVVGIVLFHLTPTLAPVFGQAGAELPTSMRLMLGARETILTSWPIILAGLVVIPLALTALIRSQSSLFESVFLKLPFIGPILRDRECQRFANTMFLMLKSGANLPEALDMAKGSTNWLKYRNLISHAAETVNSGGTLSDSLAVSPLISPILQNMLNVGERSDRLVPLLETASFILRKSHREALQSALRLLTPALTLLIGFGVGALIFSTMTAIMDINDVVF